MTYCIWSRFGKLTHKAKVQQTGWHPEWNVTACGRVLADPSSAWKDEPLHPVDHPCPRCFPLNK